MFNHERCSLSGSTVHPGARFGVRLKFLYPETDLFAESFCCRSCWLHTSCGVEGFNELLPGSNNRLPGADSCWKIPYVGWCITELGKVQITEVPWVGCKHPCSKEPCIDSQEGEQRKSHIECWGVIWSVHLSKEWCVFLVSTSTCNLKN